MATFPIGIARSTAPSRTIAVVLPNPTTNASTRRRLSSMLLNGWRRACRANVVYRTFCRIGMETVPDAKTLVRLGQAVGPEAIAELHNNRIVAVAQQRKVGQCRKLP